MTERGQRHEGLEAPVRAGWLPKAALYRRAVQSARLYHSGHPQVDMVQFVAAKPINICHRVGVARR